MAGGGYDRYDLVVEDRWRSLIEIDVAYDQCERSFTIYGAKVSYDENSGLHGDVYQDERSRTSIPSYEEW